MTHFLRGHIAHELGHLLLRTTHHGPTGLMRDNWTPESIRRNRPEDWQLSQQDIDAIVDRSR